MKPRKNAKPAQAGVKLPKLTKKITQRQIDCYSGVRPNSIHPDPAWARPSPPPPSPPPPAPPPGAGAPRAVPPPLAGGGPPPRRLVAGFNRVYRGRAL